MDKNYSIGKVGKESNEDRLQPTPVNQSLEIKSDGFTTLVDALDYAARGDSGYNFYDQHGELDTVLSYSE